jgi:hypothetical protein
MPELKESAAEKQTREASERRVALYNALQDVPQACIDLMCVVINGDEEKRSASYWLGEGFVYLHKYTDRLRKYAQERKASAKRKEDEALFAKYIAMNPVKTATELVTLMQRFGICPQVPIPAEQAPAATAASKSNAA